MSSLESGAHRYSAQHAPHGVNRDPRCMDEGELRYWSSARSVSRELREELAAEYWRRTDPDGSLRRDQAQSEAAAADRAWRRLFRRQALSRLPQAYWRSER